MAFDTHEEMVICQHEIAGLFFMVFLFHVEFLGTDSDRVGHKRPFSKD